MGLGWDGNNPTGPPKETAENATENVTGDPTAGEDTPLSVSGESLYAVLNVNKGTSDDEIQRAYRKQALRLHPNKNRDDPSAEYKFKELNRAHKVLTDEKKRQIYDKYGSLGLYIADKVGDDYVGRYFMFNKCFKITALICFIATCCCCCCCCCHCFGGCCGRCSKENGDLSSLDGGDTDEPVRNQPEASGRVNNEEFAMP